MQYYADKGRKKLRDTKHPFIIYDPHTIDLNQRQWDKDDEWIVVSIDPGLVHLAIRIEARNQKTGQIRPLFIVKQDIYACYEQYKDEWINQSMNIVYNIFDTNIHLFTNCHIWVIEKQLPVNYKAVSISKHIISWAFIKLKNNKNLPLIVEFESKQKYRMFDAPPLNERAIKKWGVEKAIEILRWRGDSQTIKFIDNEPITKRDDICDTVLIAEALFKYMNWPITREKIIINVGPHIKPASISIQGQQTSYQAQNRQPVTFKPTIHQAKPANPTSPANQSDQAKKPQHKMCQITINTNNPTHGKRFSVYEFKATENKK